MTAQATVERALPSDVDEIISVFRRGYAGLPMEAEYIDETLARGRWLRINTGYPLAGSGAWVCRRDRRIVAHIGTLPADAVVDGEIRRIAWARDLIVLPEMRGHGLATQLVVELVRLHDVVFLGGMNQRVQRIYRRLGYRDNGGVPLYVRVIRPREAVRALGWPEPARVAFALAVPLAHRVLATHRALGHVRVEPTQSFEGFDDWWPKVEHGHRRLIRRTATTMSWRYLRPDADYRIFAARGEGQLRGFAISRVGTSRGLSAGVLVELLAHPADRDALDALLAAVEFQFRQSDVVFLRCLALDRGAQGALSRAGWVRAPTTVGWMVAQRDRGEECFSRRGWMLNGGDSDFDLL